MALPDPPVETVDYGFVADIALTVDDWGSIAVAFTRQEDWEINSDINQITSLNQVPLPIDKMWAFLGEMERRKDEERC